jgi:plastocyanin
VVDFAKALRGEYRVPKKTGGRKKGLEVDFTGVESGGKAVPDGVYELEVQGIEINEGEKGQYLTWKSKVVSEGAAKGGIVYDNTSLTPQALWRLKGLLECLGVDVPDSSMELDLEEYVGMKFTATIANENYQGKDRPKIAQYGGEVTEGEESGSSAKSGKSSEKSSSSAKKSSKKSEEEGEVEEEDDIPFKAGQKVKFVDNKKSYTGKIVGIEDDKATVKTPDGDEWELDLTDLEAA